MTVVFPLLFDVNVWTGGATKYLLLGGGDRPKESSLSSPGGPVSTAWANPGVILFGFSVKSVVFAIVVLVFVFLRRRRDYPDNNINQHNKHGVLNRAVVLRTQNTTLEQRQTIRLKLQVRLRIAIVVATDIAGRDRGAKTPS